MKKRKIACLNACENKPRSDLFLSQKSTHIQAFLFLLPKTKTTLPIYLVTENVLFPEARRRLDGKGQAKEHRIETSKLSPMRAVLHANEAIHMEVCGSTKMVAGCRMDEKIVISIHF